MCVPRRGWLCGRTRGAGDPFCIEAGIQRRESEVRLSSLA